MPQRYIFLLPTLWNRSKAREAPPKSSTDSSKLQKLPLSPISQNFARPLATATQAKNRTSPLRGLSEPRSSPLYLLAPNYLHINSPSGGCLFTREDSKRSPKTFSIPREGGLSSGLRGITLSTQGVLSILKTLLGECSDPDGLNIQYSLGRHELSLTQTGYVVS